MASAPALPALLPAERHSVTHEEIDATGYGPAMKAALYDVLIGMPYRDAAREAGLASHQDLYRAAKKLGLLEIHSSKLVGGFRRLVDLTNQELERR